LNQKKGGAIPAAFRGAGERANKSSAVSLKGDRTKRSSQAEKDITYRRVMTGVGTKNAVPRGAGYYRKKGGKKNNKRGESPRFSKTAPMAELQKGTSKKGISSFKRLQSRAISDS